jgi:hypothetical protein
VADKFRQTFPIAVSFSEGELPTASKLTGLATQARSGQGIMQYALGDLWNQGGDTMVSAGDGLQDNALMIPSLSRYIGATQHLRPFIPYLPDTSEFTFAFTDYSGLHEARLSFPLASGAGTPTWSGSSPPDDKKTSRVAVVDSGDYYIDDAGNIYTYDPINSGWEITYEPEVPGSVHETATFNVIPDPGSHSNWGYRGLKVQYKNESNNLDGYYIYLPPRMPHYNFLDSDKPAWFPEPTGNMSATPSTVRTIWQSSSADAETGSNAEHYRYALPKLMTESSAWAAGASLPAGMLYLWDADNTGTIIEGVTFQAHPTSPNTWTLYVPNGTPLDDWLTASYGAGKYSESNLKSTAHDVAKYPTGGLRLITVGADMSQVIASLLYQFLNHDHASTGSLASRPLPHSKLHGLFDPTDGSTPQLDASALTNDDHPQYFHRGGFAGTTDRDKYGNAILGDVLIASANSLNNYQNLSGSSRKLYFGNTDGATGSTYVYATGSASEPVLILHAESSNGFDYGIIRLFDNNISDNYLQIRQFSTNFYMTHDKDNTFFAIDQRGSNSGLTLKSYGSGGYVDIAAGSSPPSRSGNYSDVDIRAQDDIILKAGDDATINGVGALYLRGGTINIRRNAEVVEWFMTKLQPMGTTEGEVGTNSALGSPYNHSHSLSNKRVRYYENYGYYYLDWDDGCEWLIDGLPDYCDWIGLQILVAGTYWPVPLNVDVKVGAYVFDWSSKARQTVRSYVTKTIWADNNYKQVEQTWSTGNSNNMRTNDKCGALAIHSRASSSLKLFPFCRVKVRYARGIRYPSMS